MLKFSGGPGDQREAKTLAALNHPNIARIYGLEQLPAIDGATYAGSKW